MTANKVPFTYVPITERAPLSWPGGARVAAYDEAPAYLAAQPDIWLTTSDDIAAHYLASTR